MDIASSWFQAVLILPALAWGLGYLAYSMGELFGVSSGSAIESWLARRWLMARRGTTLSVVTAISVAGVSLGTWLVIVAVAICRDLKRTLRKNYRRACPH